MKVDGQPRKSILLSTQLSQPRTKGQPMKLEQLQSLFMWMTLINIGIMILSVVLINCLRSFIHQFHGKLFKLSKEQLNIILYSYLGIYKIGIILFNLVPYIALQLVK